MAKSLSKTVLFTSAKHGSRAHQWPVAVFNGETDAKAYAMILKIAYRAGDLDSVRKLDPSVKLSDDGKLPTDAKFALVGLPYAPSPDLDDEETPAAEPAKG